MPLTRTDTTPKCGLFKVILSQWREAKSIRPESVDMMLENERSLKPGP